MPVPEDRSEMLATGDTELFVRAEGSGPPVIVVHGGPLLDHGYLEPWLRPLAADHRLVFYDQRLSGRSSAEAPPESITLERFVDDLEAVRAAGDYPRVDVIAHSWGGLIATLYAARYPERVRRLVLVGPMAPSAELRLEEELAQRERLRPQDLEAMEEVRATPAFQAQSPEGIEAMLRARFRSEFGDPSLADSLDFHIEDDYLLRSERFGALFPELERYDVTGALQAITARTLIVFGDREPGAEIGGAALAAGIPNATLRRISHSGHFPFVEQPFEFIDVVDAFLDNGR